VRPGGDPYTPDGIEAHRISSAQKSASKNKDENLCGLGARWKGPVLSAGTGWVISCLIGS
jgi:hypothetical protein